MWRDAGIMIAIPMPVETSTNASLFPENQRNPPLRGPAAGSDIHPHGSGIYWRGFPEDPNGAGTQRRRAAGRAAARPASRSAGRCVPRGWRGSKRGTGPSPSRRVRGLRYFLSVMSTGFVTRKCNWLRAGISAGFPRVPRTSATRRPACSSASPSRRAHRLYLGSEGRPASDRGGRVDSRAAGERRPR
jgi:hypothetical protein